MSTTSVTKTTTLEQFKALMTQFAVPVSNSVAIGDTGYLDEPVDDALFCGRDAYGREFINLPILITASEHYTEWMRDHPTETLPYDPEVRPSAFIIFQRYTTNPNVFVTGGYVLPFGERYMTGDRRNDLSNLQRLLAGETLRFHYQTYDRDTQQLVEDPTNWVAISLKR